MQMARCVLLLTAVALVVACAVPQRQVGDASQDSAAIRGVLDQRRDAIARSDAEGWLAAWADDARFIRPFGGEDVVGREALRKWAAPFFETLQMQYSETVEELSVSGDVAFARVSADFRTTPKAGGAQSRDLEVGILLFRKDAAGHWRISHAMQVSASPQASAR